MKRTRLTSRVPLAPAWEELLARVENGRYRQGVKRLAHYCSAMGIPPEEVRSGHLLGLHEALEAECMTKHPRKVIKHTIAMWNHFGRTVPAWPAAVLASPFASEPDTLPLARFPESFRADVARWMERMSQPDPLDPEAPIRALKPATIDELHRLLPPLRLGAGAAGHPAARTRSPASRSSSRAATSRKACGTSCRPRARAGDPSTAMAFRIARKLGHVARHYVRVDAATQKEIDLALPPARPERAAGDGPAQPRPARAVRRSRERRGSSWPSRRRRRRGRCARRTRSAAPGHRARAGRLAADLHRAADQEPPPHPACGRHPAHQRAASRSRSTPPR